MATANSAHSAEPTRRDFLYIATGAAAAVAGVAALVPLIAQMNPDASTVAAGAPIEVDLTPITEGQVIKVFWRGKPIFINHRTKKQIEDAQNVDLAPIQEGQVIKVFWRGKPIFINHRTKKQIEEAQNVNLASLPDPQPDSARVKPKHDQWQVLIGICTHLGCIPIAHQGPFNGYFCPCHGSVYDTSGRIRSGPAPTNLLLPPYEFVSDTRIRIG